MKKIGLTTLGFTCGPALLAGTLVVGLLLGKGVETHAQWTTSGSNTYTNPLNNNVGIGIDTPAATLDVLGTIRASGCSGTTGGLDIFVGQFGSTAQQQLVVDPTDRLVKLRNLNINTVSGGVFSTTRTAFIEDTGLAYFNGPVGIGTLDFQAQVKVKADARHRPIHTGDLLVTGELPGTAMASESIDFNGRWFHQPGTILGKALEPLPEGEREILVLLTLQ